MVKKVLNIKNKKKTPTCRTSFKSIPTLFIRLLYNYVIVCHKAVILIHVDICIKKNLVIFVKEGTNLYII